MARRRFWRMQAKMDESTSVDEASEKPGESLESNLGRCLRALREERGFSLRALAEDSGLSVNTISLIENGKSTPSVTTLQKISAALQVPIVAFFHSDQDEPKVVHTQFGQRSQMPFENGHLEDLGKELSEGAFRPFLVTLAPESNSGTDPLIHTGYEFVYCLSGRIAYIVDNKRYLLEPGDSLFFEANLPHCWQNLSHEPSQKILVLCPLDSREHSVERHFLLG
jgi:transcriptional regulator with XRE-family HTH domain